MRCCVAAWLEITHVLPRVSPRRHVEGLGDRSLWSFTTHGKTGQIFLDHWIMTGITAESCCKKTHAMGSQETKEIRNRVVPNVPASVSE